MDVIRIILKDLDVCDIHSALLVNREWCRTAVPFYWKAPFTQKRGMTTLKIYEMFLEQESSGTSAQGEAQKVLPFFDYPSFIKELNYTKLLKLFAYEEQYERLKKIDSILQMLTDRGVRLETFIIDNVRACNDNAAYGLWTKPRYASILSTLIHVEVHFPFMDRNFIKPLAENCTRLSHLDVNLYNNCQFAEESINSLEELISAQRCPLNLRLVLPHGPGDMLIKAFQSRLESFQRLELIKWNFSGCDWSWLNNCPNLIEFAITNPPFQVSRILGAEHESNFFKPSKSPKSRALTEHWHLDKDDEISSMQRFYFHPRKKKEIKGHLS